MEDEKEGHKVQTQSRDSGGKARKEGKLYCPGRVISSANRGSLRSHAPRICAALPEISWSVWASLLYPVRTGTLEMIGPLLSLLTLQKGVSVLNGRLTQTYLDEDQLYWTYFQF